MTKLTFESENLDSKPYADLTIRDMISEGIRKNPHLITYIMDADKDKHVSMSFNVDLNIQVEQAQEVLVEYLGEILKEVKNGI